MIKYYKKRKEYFIMIKEFENLINKFEEINSKGYIKGINNNLINSCGLTFENLLGKKADSMFFPDYEGIEIKCKQRYSRYDINLFCLSFDGPELFESNYILQKYGKRRTILSLKKELFINFNINKMILVNNKYYFELKINYIDKVIYINIYDINKRFIEKRGFIEFNSLEKRIKTKLKKLALVYASKKKENNDLYFRYYKIVCFKFKDFDTFLKMIEEGVIKLSLMLRYSKNENDYGKNKNKNMIFSINDKNLKKIYNVVFFLDN